MIQITKYKAVDGTEFYKEAECIKYEALIDEIDNVMRKLNPIPEMKDCDFANGHGFVQQAKAAFLIVKIDILNIAKRYTDHDWIQQTVDSDSVSLSYAGRIIDEMPRPLPRAWTRLMCIDKDYREWGQPYFALNPGEAPYLKKCVESN
jgi:hypothetical protein